MNNIRKELRSIELDKAISSVVDDLFPRFTKDKVLQVHIRMSVDVYIKQTNDPIREYKEFYLYFYRPHNYTFVGLLDSRDSVPTKPGLKTELKYLSFHDSCWMHSGVSHTIGCIADKMEQNLEAKLNNQGINEHDINSIHVYNDFGIFGFRLLDGIVQTNSNDRIANFVALEAPKKLEE